MLKWNFLIERLRDLIAREGQEIVVFNVDAMRDTEEQYNKYMKAVDSMKNHINAVVTTGLPGEERIFWPYHDVQFYIKKGEEKIHCTGNEEIIQTIINV